jgi:hypothetical protein
MGIAGDILWKVADFPEAQVLAQRWRKIIPKNITGDGIDPAIEDTMHKAADQIQMLQGQLQAMVKKVEDREREFQIKERELLLKERSTSDDMTMKGLKEVRDDFDALTRRFTALGNSGPGLSVEQIQPLVRQAIAEALVNGGQLIEAPPGIGEGGTPIDPEEAPEGLGEGEEQDSISDVPGSRQAADGKHYVKGRNGQYLEIEPVQGNA